MVVDWWRDATKSWIVCGVVVRSTPYPVQGRHYTVLRAPYCKRASDVLLDASILLSIIPSEHAYLAESFSIPATYRALPTNT